MSCGARMRRGKALDGDFASALPSEYVMLTHKLYDDGLGEPRTLERMGALMESARNGFVNVSSTVKHRVTDACAARNSVRRVFPLPRARLCGSIASRHRPPSIADRNQSPFADPILRRNFFSARLFFITQLLLLKLLLFYTYANKTFVIIHRCDSISWV